MADPIEDPGLGGERAIVAGATGSVGRECVRLLCEDPRVVHVTALVRSGPKPLDFFGLEASENGSKLAFAVVDYADLEASADVFDGHTIGLSALGVYSGDVSTLDEFFEREYDPNMAVARAAWAGGVRRWAYLSGQGVKQPTADAGRGDKHMFTAKFSWVKGTVERDLGILFEGGDEAGAVTFARPGGIFGRPGPEQGFYKVMSKMTFLKSTRFGIHRDDLAGGMVSSILRPIPANASSESSDGAYGRVLENEDLKAEMAEYMALVETLEPTSDGEAQAAVDASAVDSATAPPAATAAAADDGPVHESGGESSSLPSVSDGDGPDASISAEP